MIPSVISRQVERGVRDFLRTTFPITNPFFSEALDKLIEKPEALFRGPYLSLKLPFVPAEGGKRYFPEVLPETFEPYRHQQQAFERLAESAGRSTIVATGTGSGKTECFLYPILDYCHQNRGRKGIKAILIYPMNALATDQAKRLAKTIWRNPELRGYLTAGLYIGGREGKAVPVMTENDVITDRETLRRAPPDILLTNYKMLDYLLVRPADFGLWRDNDPETLRYLVVDELHTFDGAQGADLACLIRRIKERLKTPARRLIAVGTSATLGEAAGGFTAEELASYARQVFGEPFDDNAIIGESLLTADEFLKGCLVTRYLPPGADDTATMDPLAYESAAAYLRAQNRLWFGEEIEDFAGDGWRLRLGENLKSHAFFRNLLTILGNRAVALPDLEQEVERQLPGFSDQGRKYLDAVLGSFLALVSEAKAPGPVIDGEPGVIPLVQIRYQLWLRELRRMVAPVTVKDPVLAFADDLKPEELERSLPVIHCRECGLTGWGALVPDGDTKIKPDLQAFYKAYFDKQPQVRFLYPGGEDERDGQRKIPEYLCTECLKLQRMLEPRNCEACEARFEKLLPVWIPETNRKVKYRKGAEHLKSIHNCPACGGMESLTILGSRAASLTSVVIAQLFTSPFNFDKKLLAFSDSVQDASHRAGFFGARTYSFNLRAAIQKVVRDAGAPIPFPKLPEEFYRHWLSGDPPRMTEPEFIATFLPPDMNWLEDYEYLRENGSLPDGSNLLELVKRRLRWELWSEYTFNCRIGRTLEKTGASTIEADPEPWRAAVERLLVRLRENIGVLRDLERGELERFLHGFVQNLKNRGGVGLDLLDEYLKSFGNTWLLGKQKGREVWRPNVFQRAPSFLASRPGERFLSLTRGGDNPTATWHEDWLEKCFRGADGPVRGFAREIYEEILAGLRESGLIKEWDAKGARVWGLEPGIFRATPEVVQFRCGKCNFAVSVGAAAADSFADTPCTRFRCGGRFQRCEDKTEDYYRRLYEAGDVQRVFTDEHTGLLERATRERIEEGFRRNGKQRHPGDPNVLSCTPTLEMGINIGDLSSLALCSVPPKPSNYLQRVGRAGRVDGNSFVLTVANAQPHDLFFYFEPEEMIQGLVEPPGCFLNASAVLERQFTAYVFDRWVESGIPVTELPEEMRPVLDVAEAGDRSRGFPANFLSFFERNRTPLEDGFLALFADEIADYTRERILAFSRGTSEDLERPGLERSIWEGIDDVVKERKTLRNRIKTLGDKIRELQRDPARRQNADEDLDTLKKERAALNNVVTALNKKNVLNFFTDEGLLPNYAFPEAGVVLRSVIYRRVSKAEAGGKKYTAHTYEYQRPASSAIAELAPANHFYAEGRKLEIDQVSLQHSKLEVWRFCDNCSYVELEGLSEQRRSCPRCGSTLWADEGQRRTMLRMRQVVSTMSEEASRSYDESDDRKHEFYQKDMFVGKDDADITDAYYIDNEEVPFGFEFFQKVTLREVNFGEKQPFGGQLTVAGKTLVDQPFELCGACGKVKKGGTLDHAVYCRYWRKEERETTIEACYLYREFSSEAIRILLPVASVDVERNVHSFVAALDLGLRKTFRGDPGHLLTTLMNEPIEGSDVRKQYLVLYDGVPGGTGYLKELMRDETKLLEVFQRAYDVLKNCSCQKDPDKDGCYRCLLAYHGRHDYQNTSRQAAMRLLSSILENRHLLKRTKKLDIVRINRLLESELEGRFIEALRRAPEGEPARSVKQQVVNGKQGFYLRVEGEGYLIEPQVELGPRQGVAVPSRADFVLYPERPAPGQLPIAVYTDGYEFHADPNGDMRVGVDTAQRLALIRSGKYRVWSLTWQDVAEQLEPSAPAFDSQWLVPGKKLLSLLKNSGTVGEWPVVRTMSSFSILLLLLGRGKEWAWSRYAAAWCLSLVDARKVTRLARDAALLELRRVSEESGPSVESAVREEVADHLAFRIEKSYGEGAPAVAAAGGIATEDVTAGRWENLKALFRLYDENAHRDPASWQRCWREYFRLMNLLQFHPGIAWCSSEGLFAEAYGSLLDEKAAPAGEDEKVAALLELADESVRELIRQVAARGKALPTPGFELTSEEGEIIATAELGWGEQKVAVVLEEELAGRPAFEQRGWRVFALSDLEESCESLLVLLPEEETK